MHQDELPGMPALDQEPEPAPSGLSRHVRVEMSFAPNGAGRLLLELRVPDEELRRQVTWLDVGAGPSDWTDRTVAFLWDALGGSIEPF